MKDHRDQLCMVVSAGASDLLTNLGQQLLITEQLVSDVLFSSLLEKLSQGLDQLILTEVSPHKAPHRTMSTDEETSILSIC